MSRRKGRRERESTTVKISGVAFNIVTSSWAFSSCTFGYIPNLYEICGPKSSALSVGEQKQTRTPVAVSSPTEYVRIL